MSFLKWMPSPLRVDAVVSNLPVRSWRDVAEDDDIPHYGGYLVAESIPQQWRAPISAVPDLLTLARAVADHFQDTDAPLGIEARAVLTKAGQP